MKASDEMNRTASSSVTQSKTLDEDRSEVIDSGEYLKVIENKLRSTLAEELMINERDVDVEANFTDMGLDSIVGVSWVKKINDMFCLNLAATVVYNFPALCELTEHVLDEVKKLGHDLNPGVEVRPVPAAPDIHKEDPDIQQNIPSESQNGPPEIKSGTGFQRFQRHSLKYLWRPSELGDGPPRKLHEKIAVIGMSGIFPKSEDLEQFWDIIKGGVDCVAPVPKSRWDMEKYYDPDPEKPGKSVSKWMAAMSGVDHFDPLVFRISPLEAQSMDPQQRKILEQSWACLENAGYSPNAISGTKCGVFVGCGGTDYSVRQDSTDERSLMGAEPSILSARIAYLMNLQGPCIAIDTACSSSLVAIAEACNSIVLGDSDVALAGGVSMQFSPLGHIMTSKAGMLSKDGKCFTFDERANGFVRGEGVGVLMLKKLSQAEKDHDCIQGVISGWGVNQDGKTNGITAPNQKSQTRLQKDVYDKFDIDPASITLVEAHGTGTRLGDPIEVEALIDSFSAYTDKQGYCALGSVKSNIGHIWSAAGIAGIIKILLAQRHKMLPPTINFKTLNSHIRLDGSPFYINTQLKPWKSDSGHPRRAAVSSFGFSGTNAHVVVEEYIAPQQIGMPVSPYSGQPVVIVLSARNEKQLMAYANKLLAALDAGKYEDSDLSNMAYTLQIGRKAMDVRLALIAGSIKEIVQKLNGFTTGQSDVPNLYHGKVKGDDTVRSLQNDKDFKWLIDKWVEGGNIRKLAELWVKGLKIDWNKLYEGLNPYKLIMPTYPFEKLRCWIPDQPVQVQTDMGQSEYLHPLLHINSSVFYGQRFNSTYSGSEPFLSDHKVMGHPVLPGVAYLEMIRAAVNHSVGGSDIDPGIMFRNVVWVSPITVRDNPVQIHTSLSPMDDGSIDWRVYSGIGDEGEQELLHSQGAVVIGEAHESVDLDIDGIKKSCNHRTLSSDQCYHLYEGIGFDYGPAYRGVETLYCGRGQVLAKLALPEICIDTRESYVLHPSLMDAALHACIGILDDADSGDEQSRNSLVVPFALEEAQIFGALPNEPWAWLRTTGSSEGSKSGSTTPKWDADICDRRGRVSVRIRGLSTRVLDEHDVNATVSYGKLIMRPVWKEKTPDNWPAERVFGQHLVVLCEPHNDLAEVISAGMDGVDVDVLHSDESSLAKRYHSYATTLFKHIQRLYNSKPTHPVLIQVIVFPGGEGRVMTGLGAMLKTARLENPKLMGQLIEVDSGQSARGLIEMLREDSVNAFDEHIRYQNKTRLVAHWQETDSVGKPAAVPWKEKGVYLITGGAGGIGLLVAKDIAHQVTDPCVILTGRSEPGQDIQKKIEQINENGARIQYRQVDVTRKKAVTTLIKEIIGEFGRLNGVIHSAGVIRDGLINKKTIQELEDVLAPKVSGTVQLDLAIRHLMLDFILLFSSGAGIYGNVGQADYACANAFMDAFAAYRNEMVSAGRRHGVTLSINWPLWKDGGMQPDPEIQKNMARSTGMAPLDTQAGVETIYQALASGPSQVLVLYGRVSRLRQKFLYHNTLDFRPQKQKHSVLITHRQTSRNLP